MNTIYVIVEVSYDWYRFQNNLVATTSEEQAVALAEEIVTHANYNGWPILRSNVSSANCDCDEKSHIWIQEFPQ